MSEISSSEWSKRLRDAAEPHTGDSKVPGLVAVVGHGDEVHRISLGLLGTGRAPVEGNSIFRISSMTKPITAAATLALVREGLIGLDERVARLLPELSDPQVLRHPDGALDDTVPADRAITVRDLLNFTFGFGMTMEMFFAKEPWPIVTAAEQHLRLATLGPPNPSVQPEPDTWIAGLGSLPLIAQPGTRWLYNTGSAVLGVLLARAAGTTFAEVLHERIFEPLRTVDTGFWTDHPDRLATAYRPTAEGLVVSDEADGDYSHPPKFEDGGAGLVSTADDLFKFAAMLREDGGTVLLPEHVRAMTTDQLRPEQKVAGAFGPEFFKHRSWGFGVAVQDSGALGWDGGLGSSFLIDPVRDLTVIVLTQRMFETPAPPQVHQDILAAAYAAST
jgi:CubicO group peptidase (beta-lactamase class C family)